MNEQFECTKIKDGLYIGNIVACHDYEFLLINKFGFVVNCASQIPNVFEHQNLKYLKFKLVQGKPHKLWDQTLKKLKKFQKFIEQAEQLSMCCLVHSFHGENRNLVFVTAYLMKKYQWRLRKSLEYLKSKNIFIGLSSHYITQLQILQQILSKTSILSMEWTPPYLNEQEQIISKTYLNSLQKNNNFTQITKPSKKQISDKRLSDDNTSNKKKKGKRVVWQDRIDKKQKKQAEVLKKQLQKKLQEQKLQMKNLKMQDFEQQQNQSQSSSVRNKQTKKIHKRKKAQDAQLITQAQKNVYKFTINNYIQPNFNIINKSQPLLKKSRHKEQKQGQGKKRPISAGKKSQKINRAQSQKETLNYNKEKKTTVIKAKQRDIKKQLKRQIEKVEKQKSSHSLNSFHLLYPVKNSLSNGIKRNAGTTPTKKRDKKSVK